MCLAYKFKVQCSNYQLVQTSYTSSYCLLAPSVIVGLKIEIETKRVSGRSFVT